MQPGCSVRAGGARRPSVQPPRQVPPHPAGVSPPCCSLNCQSNGMATAGIVGAKCPPLGECAAAPLRRGAVPGLQLLLCPHSTGVQAPHPFLPHHCCAISRGAGVCEGAGCGPALCVRPGPCAARGVCHLVRAPSCVILGSLQSCAPCRMRGCACASCDEVGHEGMGQAGGEREREQTASECPPNFSASAPRPALPTGAASAPAATPPPPSCSSATAARGCEWWRSAWMAGWRRRATMCGST